MSQHIYLHINSLRPQGSRVGLGGSWSPRGSITRQSHQCTPMCHTNTFMFYMRHEAEKKKKKPGNYCPTAQAARKTVKNLDAQTVNYPQSVTLIYSETPWKSLAARRNSWNGAQCYSCFLDTQLGWGQGRPTVGRGEEPRKDFLLSEALKSCSTLNHTRTAASHWYVCCKS